MPCKGMVIYLFICNVNHCFFLIFFLLLSQKYDHQFKQKEAQTGVDEGAKAQTGGQGEKAPQTTQGSTTDFSYACPLPSQTSHADSTRMKRVKKSATVSATQGGIFQNPTQAPRVTNTPLGIQPQSQTKDGKYVTTMRHLENAKNERKGALQKPAWNYEAAL